MRKRIFVCCNSKLPHGDANSNYIYHMCRALAFLGWEVVAIGTYDGEEKIVKSEQNITCVNLPFKKKILPKRIKGNLIYGRLIKNELEQWNVTASDYFLLYGGYVSMFSVIAKAYGRIIPSGHVTTCVVEWPMKSQYKLYQINPIYLFWHKIFYKWIPYWKKVVVISNKLKQHFEKVECETFYLPPLIDSESVKVRRVGNNQDYKVKFIYAGAFSKKDALDNMLMSLELLSDDELAKFQFHLTNNKEEALREYLGEHGDVLDKFKDVLCIHGWMEYEELLKLYEETDYLLLARPTNQYTLSNFPSKVPEMMNYGIVPVCSKVGDYTSIFLKDGIDSIIFEGDRPEDCAKAIRRALNKSKEERVALKKNAKESSEKLFDYRNWGEKLSEFIIK